MQNFFDQVVDWAHTQEAVRAVCVVGSHARGQARPDSDIDLVILCSDPRILLEDSRWREVFGDIEKSILEDWGEVKSLRTFYRGGLEVEFGITSLKWAAVPLDPGTQEVASSGLKILYDPSELLDKLQRITKTAG